MLLNLSISNVVLIDRLELSFENGLCVLTGETGAGKSILLDSLGLALGARAESRLVRQGTEKATVSAVFDPIAAHPVFDFLKEKDVAIEDDLLVFRRVLNADGRSRAYINDTPVSANLLRQAGDLLIEIQGQFEQRGLLDQGNHRNLLDAASDNGHLADRTATLWQKWQRLVKERSEADEKLAQAQREETFLRHSLEELDGLSPVEGELETLSSQRQLLIHSEKLIEAMNACTVELSGENGIGGAENSLAEAQRHLTTTPENVGEKLQPVIEALDRATFEIQDALSSLQAISNDLDLDLDPAHLQETEERYFLYQDLARKHRVEPEELSKVRDTISEQLKLIDTGNEHLQELDRRCEDARNEYAKAAESLSKSRHKKAKELDRAINNELPPLKLERAVFQTSLVIQSEENWGQHGWDQVAFLVATNSGATPGPLDKIASGGELARFLLALKVVMAKVSPVDCLVFDEVDAGIGGATAHAVGERLSRLADERQILVITHSPQVAAKGVQHLKVSKSSKADQTTTTVFHLNNEERREEVARMLSGAEITNEARSAADSLLG
ncbi:DNA recombination protein RecN [Kiloniella litopenaei]|uniref:DNA repair protein RecN n=1 Tax=Kiloniella litopenaei TaxID=1549748 RepID=A0A0M2REL1_9PROT|nr:DNA repair protein RecN [Kiloniella litopenaei]KKJ78450.1 DNA recombination protein RecN [Kiloniella litopenaei]